MVTIHTHQLNAGDLGVEGLITESDVLAVRIRIPLRSLTGIPNRVPQMRNLEYVLRVVLLRIHKLRHKAGIEKAVLLTVVIDSPGIRRNIVAIGVGDISCSSYCRILRRNDRVNERGHKSHRESGRGNSRATAAYGRAHNVLLVHTKKSFP